MSGRMNRLKKNIPRKGDILIDKVSGRLVVFTGINPVYDMAVFEYVGIDGIIYTYGCDIDYSRFFNKVSI